MKMKKKKMIFNLALLIAVFLGMMVGDWVEKVIPGLFYVVVGKFVVGFIILLIFVVPVLWPYLRLRKHSVKSLKQVHK
jgi:uncharacterized membrane protein YcjF (UPF0283 family)